MSDRLVTKIGREIKHEGPSFWLDGFWEKVFAGDSAGARELLPELEAAGVKMPPMF